MIVNNSYLGRLNKRKIKYYTKLNILLSNIDFSTTYITIRIVSIVSSIYVRIALAMLSIRDRVKGSIVRHAALLIIAIKTKVEDSGEIFRVSDMYCDWMILYQAHQDWKEGSLNLFCLGKQNLVVSSRTKQINRNFLPRWQ